MASPSDPSRLSRRQVIKMFTAVSASLGLSEIPSISRAATMGIPQIFANLDVAQQSVLCDDICNRATAKPEFKKAAAFFLKLRSLCAAGYYSTQEGWKAIGFVGNLPSATFEGPPPEVLRQLGVEQTVK